MPNMHKYFQENYNVDIYKDVILKNDQHVEFIFDKQKMPINIYIIKGNPTLIGLPSTEKISFEELIKFVDPDNALAEIEGKKTFIKDLVRKIASIEEDLYVFIPLRRDSGTIWLTVGFYVINKNHLGVQLVHGKVHRASETTPLEIIYYKKAYQDELTGLFTREALKLHFKKLHKTQGAYGLFIDIDGFKSVNDRFGHKTGNLLLKLIADKFISNWEKNVIYYRLGGDEFFVYVWGHNDETVLQRAKNIIKSLESLEHDDIKFDISAAIGIVPIESENIEYSTLLDVSDSAMYKAKSKGRGQIHFVKTI